MKPLDEFHIDYPVFSAPGTRRLDRERINALPDEEFLSIHRQLMEEYRNNGWWEDGNIPSCYRCHEPILGPERLIRYFGSSYDPSCFKDVWADERTSESARNPDFGRYLDRLVELLVRDGS